MPRLSNFNTVFFIAFLIQALTVHGLPEPRSTTDVVHCGFVGAAPYCPSGFTCCGPLFDFPDGTLLGAFVYYLYISRNLTDVLTTLPVDITAVLPGTDLAVSSGTGTAETSRLTLSLLVMSFYCCF
ncbi:hypothetical protein BDP27DRAFT_1412816 [Rhodocollybia butyracea]|uniref:Hydrophobin n=1 Tax=Rhodocollybia butyracea TaxID=206335 RepID=A0A9P5QBD0_9AGAR|nr:hypothetical protein BDP27DRAFT_1412816 [Rhodocollybia butyracea]